MFLTAHLPGVRHFSVLRSGPPNRQSQELLTLPDSALHLQHLPFIDSGPKGFSAVTEHTGRRR